MMLDDDDGAALVNEPMENIDELGDIMGVQANGWFFQNVESRLATTGRLHLLGRSGGAPRELRDEFDPLGLTAA